MGLTEADIQNFSDWGILALRGFLPRKSTLAAKDAIVEKLKELNLLVGGKIASSRLQGLPVFQQIGRLGQMVGPIEEVNSLFTDELLNVVNSLANKKLTPTQPQILLSFPHKTDWSLNNLNWHLDLTPPKEDQIPGIQAFLLIDDVQPNGGATLALAGSHKLPYTSRTKNAHEALRQNSDFAVNPEKYREPQVIEGVQIQIIEMSGRAGDVFLMDLRVLHSPSINAQRNIRMMTTSRYI